MGKRGTKPRPTAEHRERGTYRRDRHGGRADELPSVGEPVLIAGLSAAGKALWRRIVDENRHRKILGEVDSESLFTCCRVWELLAESLRQAAKSPTDKESRSSVASYQAAFATWAARFGLTPADRANMRMTAAADESDIPTRSRE